MSNFEFPGQELRERREKLKLSVDDVYRKLRIPVEFIDAIESGNMDTLPDMCYTTGFLKTYCELLDLDGEAYADTLTECTRPSEGGFLHLTKADGTPRRFARWNDIVAWAAVSAILVLAWLTYSVTIHEQAAPADRQVQAGSVERSTEPPQPLR